ncbi:MAG TPA: DNA translocase FtsK [Clostridia bacterium]|nr:DNA translocase FtsK [Clostridia bacterium]
MKQTTKKKRKKDNEISNNLRSELLGIFEVAIALFLFFSLLLPAKTGILGGFLFRVTTSFFGQGAYFFPFIICVFGISKMLSKKRQFTKTQNYALFVLFLVVISIIHLLDKSASEFEKAFKGSGGGILGFIIIWCFEKIFAKLGSFLILTAIGISSILIIFNKSLVGLFVDYANRSKKKRSKKENKKIEFEQFDDELEEKVEIKAEPEINESDAKNNDKTPELIVWNDDLSIDNDKLICEDNDISITNNDKNDYFEVAATLELNTDSTVNYSFPPISLLNKDIKGQTFKNKKELHQSTKLLEDTLLSFGVNAKVVKVSRGPTITRYEVQPAPGVKVSKIVNLADDIALSMAAADIRIEAPIPNKSAVGIEVPNKEIAVVYLRDIIESPEFQNNSSKLSVALGKDVAGAPIVADLQKMPHLLIAGATGTGKSVCINTIISSLLFKAQPSEVKLLMVDPKVVELNVYNNIPHLVSPVVTDPKKAATALKWVVAEMENRYSLFASNGARDIHKYNEILKERQNDGILPYIVVIIDELADLMMVAPNDVEDAICRIAQMARAAGIHLVIATQRPSVDVITGLIKANIPSRISFAVSSQIDSRTILDIGGAEKLLGKGDMLYYPSGASKPIRVQGCFISDKEVEAVTDFWKKQAKPEYAKEIFKFQPKEEKTEVMDELFYDALRLVVETNQASVSLLQRRLKIGYTRAARLIDALEEKGYIGPYEGSKPREVLATAENLRIINEYKEKNK